MLSNVYRVTSCSTDDLRFRFFDDSDVHTEWAFAHQSLKPGRGQLVSAKHQVNVTRPTGDFDFA